MNERQLSLVEAVERQRPLIYEVEKYIWEHPETGFREWNTHRYLKETFENLGYTVTEAGNIPGFYTDIDTGRPGPKVLVMAELDGLLCPAHPESVDGKAHSCGHHAQCATLVGIAAALKEPGVLDNLCGSVRIMTVPAEELIELEYRDGLREQGIIRYRTGKPEFISRGLMDGCDVGFLFHGRPDDNYDFVARGGANGSVSKTIAYRGKSAHAGLAPHQGINALYAATLGLQAVNSMRETFRDEDHIRVHPVITNGGSSVNSIPDIVTIESYVRGATTDAISEAAMKADRALAGAAAAMGTTVEVSTRPGYIPLRNDPVLLSLAEECMVAVAGEDRVDVDMKGWITGSTDMGDLSAIMPVIHPYCCGASGVAHGSNYKVNDKERVCMNSARCQILLIDKLLSNNAENANRVIECAKPKLMSKDDFLSMLDSLTSDKSLVEYHDGGININL